MSGKVLSRPEIAPARTQAGASDAAWRCLAWFGIVVGFVGFADVALVFYPARFGDPTWEFGVVDSAVSSLPLLIMGLAAIMGAAMARKRPAQIRAAAVVALLLALLILAAWIMYMTTAPLAVRVSPPEIKPGIYKSIARTTIMSVAFGGGLVVAAAMAFRSLRTRA